ncbi:MAG: adenine phosphoribosyltransferase [Actinobacteria bacterium]|nr:MAG: adenine phosphoribosyltransferase [Actinomycetota bacterium]
MPDSLEDRLCGAFAWRDGKDSSYADPTGWWRDPDLLRDTADALAALHGDATPTVIAGVESRGFILGAAVAVRLGLGFVEIRKDSRRALDPGEAVIRSTTPPDYNQRDLVLLLNRGLLGPRDRVVLVDEWMATGAQATAARDLVEAAEARWVGAALVVEDIPSEVRRRLNVRSLLRKHQLPWW